MTKCHTEFSENWRKTISQDNFEDLKADKRIIRSISYSVQFASSLKCPSDKKFHFELVSNNHFNVKHIRI